MYTIIFFNKIKKYLLFLLKKCNFLKINYINLYKKKSTLVFTPEGVNTKGHTTYTRFKVPFQPPLPSTAPICPARSPSQHPRSPPRRLRATTAQIHVTATSTHQTTCPPRLHATSTVAHPHPPGLRHCIHCGTLSPTQHRGHHSTLVGITPLPVYNCGNHDHCQPSRPQQHQHDFTPHASVACHLGTPMYIFFKKKNVSPNFGDKYLPLI